MAGDRGKGTFVIKVLNTQNATWQGTINWLEGDQSEAFRSALELIKLVDSALVPKDGEKQPRERVAFGGEAQPAGEGAPGCPMGRKGG